ncbi:MAG: 30S ribosome-binding factor RbfA [Bacilli bacterium]|nr:30S ribosome-binding factor RbfA [Bacilli bacterium]
MADKLGRVTGIIQKDLSKIIIYELKNSLTDFASITEVKVTSDYSYATIYVSHIDPDKIDEVVAYLTNRKGQIRSMLARELAIYKTPELIFKADKLYDQAHEMDVMINDAINRKPVTLKDVYGKNYKTPEEKEKAKAARAAKKASATKKTTAKKTTKAKTAKKATKKA